MPFSLKQLEFLKEEFFDSLNDNYFNKIIAETKARKERDPTFILVQLAEAIVRSTKEPMDETTRIAYETMKSKDPVVLLEKKIAKFKELKKVIEEDVRIMKLKESVNNAKN
jgi:hypothetical protein